MNRKTSLILRAAAACALLSLTAAGVARGQNLVPPTQALPERTMLSFEVPQPMKLVEHLREHTRFGKLLLDEQRWTDAVKMIREEGESEWDEMAEALAKVGLTPEDLPQYLTGRFGYALVVEPRRPADVPPLVIGLAWLEPGEQAAQKALDAVGKAVERYNDENEQFPVRRIDSDIDGQSVMQLMMPIVTYEYQHDEEAPFGPWDQVQPQHVEPRQDGEAPAAWADEGEAYEVEQKVTDQANVFLARIGGRLLIAHTIPTNYQRVRAATAEGKDADFDALSGVEKATGVFARFLAQQQRGEGVFLQRVMATPGLRDTLPKGVPAFELFADVRPLIKLLDDYIGMDADADAQQARRMLQTFGADQLSGIAVRMSFDRNIARTGAFLAAPAPRRGLVALLDQPTLPTRPADWVPADIVDYTHIAFDLGDAWKRLRGLLREAVPEEGQAQMNMFFQQADTQLRQMAGVDLAGLLSGLGHRHTIIQFEPKMPDRPERDPEDHWTPEPDPTRMALVWSLANERAWNQLTQGAIGMMAMGNDQIEATDEQGFSGWRIAAPNTDLGLMLGKGKMLFAMGENVTGQVLSVLRKAPEGRQALANSELMQQARQIIDMPPRAWVYQLTDGDRMINSLLEMISKQIDMEMKHAAADERQVFQRFVKLLPTREQMKGMFGVSTGYGQVTDHGVASHSAAWLSRP